MADIDRIQRGDIQFGDVVVVSGCGPLGLGMVAAAKKKSPKMIIAIDFLGKLKSIYGDLDSFPADYKLEVATLCGADILLNPQKVDVVEEIKRLTEGYGCDV